MARPANTYRGARRNAAKEAVKAGILPNGQSLLKGHDTLRHVWPHFRLKAGAFQSKKSAPSKKAA